MKRLLREHVLILLSEDDAEWQLTAFERALGEALLAGGDARLKPARAQFRRARVPRRELTGSGFIIDLYIPDEAPLGDPAFIATPLGDAAISGAGLEHPASALLWAERGRLLAIEATLPDWPHASAEAFLSGVAADAEIRDGDGRAWFAQGRCLIDE